MMDDPYDEDGRCPGCDEAHSDGRCCRCGEAEHPETKEKAGSDGGSK